MEMGHPQVGDEFSMTVGFAPTHGTPVSMGNPHYVVFVTDFSPGWQKEGAEIGRHQDFKQGVKVEFARVKDGHDIEVRFYQRGGGATHSSGTGSCPSAVAAIDAGYVKSPAQGHPAGGR